MDAMLIPTLLCPKAWEKMSGNETTRFCSYCQKHVHNLEAMSVSERLKLLSSPAASICARYQVAIRRPAPGKKESYMRHLMKYGAGVAVTGSVLLVLWEMKTGEEKRAFYRTAAGLPGMKCLVPSDLYEERHYVIMGDVAFIPPPPSEPASEEASPSYIDLDLAHAEVDRLMEVSRPHQPGRPPVVPVNTK